MTKPTPIIEVTEEMRQAVYTADCLAKEHLFSFNVVSLVATSDGSRMDIGGGGKIAHVSCARCGKVWLLIEEPGLSYDDAVAKLKGRMVDPSTVVPMSVDPIAVTPTPLV
jgi:hypothetical protein